MGGHGSASPSFPVILVPVKCPVPEPGPDTGYAVLHTVRAAALMNSDLGDAMQIRASI